MIYLILAGICFGGIGIFVKGIGNNISTLLIVAIRLLSTAGLVLAYETTRGKLKKLRLTSNREAVIAVAGGLVGFALTFSLYLKSLVIIPVSKAVFLHYVAFPFSTILYSAVVLKERLTKYEILSLVGAIIGVFLIYNVAFSTDSASILGYTMAFLSGVTYSAVLLVLKNFGRTRTTLQTLFWPALFGGVGLVPVVFIEGVKFNLDGGAFYNLLGLVLVSTLAGYALFARGLMDTRAGLSSIVLITVEPLTAVVLAIVFLNEQVSTYTVAGGTLIVVSGVFAYLAKIRADRRQGQET